MRLAHDRGITVTAAIWDHIYRGGVQTGRWPEHLERRTPVCLAFVWGVTGDNLAGLHQSGIAPVSFRSFQR